MSTDNDSKYVQQHLANERTFLAWIRTSLAIVGLGFVAAGLVFRSTPRGHIGQGLSAVAGFGAVLLGGTVAALAAKDYFAKRKGINEGRFRSSALNIVFVFAALGLIDILLLLLVWVLFEP